MNHFSSKWEKVGLKPRHGIAVPLSALHSKKSQGIGEILDLIPLLDWMKKAGMDLLQLLPLNDSGNDPSPYNSLSATTLNPVYLSLPGRPNLGLENRGRVNYLEVRKKKERYLVDYLQEEGKGLKKLKTYESFLEHFPWIKRESEQKQLVQYLLYEQFVEVRKYADQLGIFLVGDSPILLSKESLEFSLYPHYFVEELTVGAPPDAYNEEGQNWGFPPFNWKEICQDDYLIWKERLSYAEEFFPLFRLDHIVGFFRLFVIPEGKEAKEGYFLPSEPTKWIKQGKDLLKWLNNHTKMALIGEDLGTVPSEVKQIMEEMAIPGTKVMRWEKDWETTGEFIPLHRYPLYSLTTLSTHDSETLAGWWQTHQEEAKAFAKAFSISYEPHMSRLLRKEILSLSHKTNSLLHINPLQEYLSLRSEWGFETAEEERINIPGTISPKNWSFRYKAPLEEWTSSLSFIEEVREII